ncbi:MAG: VTT domain-containing protein [Acidobacteriota bacterium]
MHNYLLFSVGAFFKSLQGALIAYGAFGLILIALIDASLIPLPGGPDVVIIALSHHSHGMMPVYVVAAVIGSTLGSLFLYSIALRGGERVLNKFSAAQRERATRLVDRYDFWALLVAAVLPPPFPFKIFVLSAGAFRMKLWRFIGALILGRGFRFTLEGLLAVIYGELAIDILKHHYPKIGLGVAGAVLVIFVVNSLLRKRRLATEATPEA